jgi:hypothetical protein
MTGVNTPENREKVAKEFLRILGTWFAKGDPRGLGRDYPKKLTPEVVANANDYYDANMAMDEAFRNLKIPLFVKGVIPDDSSELFNTSWNRAIELAKVAA